MKLHRIMLISLIHLLTFNAIANEVNTIDISNIVSKEEFSKYKDVADFIDYSPKVTIIDEVEKTDIKKYGSDVRKTLTGSDCDRDGKMDDNITCNQVYYKLWLKYQR